MAMFSHGEVLPSNFCGEFAFVCKINQLIDNWKQKFVGAWRYIRGHLLGSILSHQKLDYIGRH